MLKQSFITYDEVGDTYLKMTETLIFRELEALINRTKTKQNTRRKLLADIDFSEYAVMSPDMDDDQLLRARNQAVRIARQFGNAQANASLAMYASFTGYRTVLNTLDVELDYLTDAVVSARNNDPKSALKPGYEYTAQYFIENFDPYHVELSDGESEKTEERNVSGIEIEGDQTTIHKSELVEQFNMHPKAEDFDLRRESKRNYVPHPFGENKRETHPGRRESDQVKIPEFRQNRFIHSYDFDETFKEKWESHRHAASGVPTDYIPRRKTDFWKSNDLEPIEN